MDFLIWFVAIMNEIAIRFYYKHLMTIASYPGSIGGYPTILVAWLAAKLPGCLLTGCWLPRWAAEGWE